MTKTAKTQISKSKEPKSEKPRVKRQKDHDIFVRGILSINTLVLKLLLHYIPKDVQPFLDFSTLKDITDTQVSNKLRLTQSDSIHECMLNVSKLPESVQQMDDLPTFRFCFLWEHKSSKPQNPIEFQVESYRYGIIYADLKKELPPSIVIPILIYHGQEAWDKKRLFERVEAYLPPELLAYIPYPKYIIIDLQAMSEADIEALSDLEEIRAAFIALKYAHDKDFFKQNMKKVLKFTRDLTATYMFKEFFKMLLEYMQRRAQIETEEFEDIVEQNIDDEMATKKVFKTMFEVREERAKLEGELKGKLEGELKGELKGLRKAIFLSLKTASLTDAQIAFELDIDESFVKSVRQEFIASQQQA
jgi:Putative transposase, YhgA-like